MVMVSHGPVDIPVVRQGQKKVWSFKRLTDLSFSNQLLVSTSTVQEDQPAVQARQVSTAVLAEEKSAKDSEESHKEDGSLDGIDIESHPAPNAAERIAKIFRRYDIIRKCHQAKDRCRNDEQCCTNLECVRAKSSDKYGRCKNVEIW